MVEYRQLDNEALVSAVRALEALAHERTVARLKQDSDDINSNLEITLDGSYALPYDPASVFLLETMVSIACQTSDSIEELWSVPSRPRCIFFDERSSPRPVVFEHFSALLSTPSQYSILLIERAVVGLLRLCLILATKVLQPISLRENCTNKGFSLLFETRSTYPSTCSQAFHLKSQPQ